MDLDLFGVWGSSPTDIWVVGVEVIVVHFDGLMWTVMFGFSIMVALCGIWGMGSNDFYVVADSNVGIWYWNGTKWTK